ncbi:hypothetical protein ACOMHN_037510 [Nucella lapillus]
MRKTKRFFLLLAISLTCALLAIYIVFGMTGKGHRPRHHFLPHAASLDSSTERVVILGGSDRKQSLLEKDTLPEKQTPLEKDTLLEKGTLPEKQTLFADALPHNGTNSGTSTLQRDAFVPEPLLRVLVLTYKRARSLQRCLDSLNAAEYDGLPVEMEIHVDRSRDQKLHNDTVHAAQTFVFKHGRVNVFVRPRHGGVVGQWLSSWRVPLGNESEMAVFIEDDLTVSPYFARWLRRVHGKYDGYPGVGGYTLQAETVRHAEGTDSSLMRGPAGQRVYAYPVVGSWGFSPNTGVWREFIRWYHSASRQEKFIPLVPGLKASGWYNTFVRTDRTDTMWTMWHIYYSTKHHQYTLYPNLPDSQGLAFNWKEPGEHYSSGVMGKGLRARLLDHWQEEDLALPDRLVVMDVKGRITGQKLTPSGLEG